MVEDIALDWDSVIGGSKVDRTRERRDAVVGGAIQLSTIRRGPAWSQCPAVFAIQHEIDPSIAAEAIKLEVESATEEKTTRFPVVIQSDDFCAYPLPTPLELIKGILHKGSKLIYGGPSKAVKSWTLMDLGIAVATGGEWFGLQCAQGRALYINLELQPFAVQYRLEALKGVRDIQSTAGLDVWNLRGHTRRLSALTGLLLKQIEGEGYDIIIPDPIYKAYAGIDENRTSDVSEACREIEEMADKTGAAIAYGAHFAKGNASSKMAIDRVSGSGVWARDPDSIVTATPHEEDDAFTIDIVLRNFAPIKPFVVMWSYPRLERTDLDPDALQEKPIAGAAGRKASHTIHEIVDILDEPMTAAAWYKAATAEMGLSKSTFFRLLKELSGYVRISKKGRHKMYERVRKDEETASGGEG